MKDIITFFTFIASWKLREQNYIIIYFFCHIDIENWYLQNQSRIFILVIRLRISSFKKV